MRRLRTVRWGSSSSVSVCLGLHLHERPDDFVQVLNVALEIRNSPKIALQLLRSPIGDVIAARHSSINHGLHAIGRRHNASPRCRCFRDPLLRHGLQRLARQSSACSCG